MQPILNSAEPEKSVDEAGGGRLAALLRASVMAVLAATLSVAAYHAVCGGFWSYDDMGFFMLTQKTLAAGHPLYDETFTLYGPAYYAWQQFLRAVTGQPLSHDTTLLFTTMALVAVPLLFAGYVARLARNLFLTAFTCFAVFDMLLVNLKSEPGHPQELCALLLGAMLLASSLLSCARRGGILLGVIGLLGGLLSMTKPNLGVFAAVAGALTFSRFAPAGKARGLLFGASALAAIVLPAALMRHNLPAAGPYCVIASGAILVLLLQLARWQPEQTVSWRAFAAALTGFGGGVLGLCSVRSCRWDVPRRPGPRVIAPACRV